MAQRRTFYHKLSKADKREYWYPGGLPTGRPTAGERVSKQEWISLAQSHTETRPDGVRVLTGTLMFNDEVIVGSAEWFQFLNRLALSLRRPFFWEPRSSVRRKRAVNRELSDPEKSAYWYVDLPDDRPTSGRCVSEEEWVSLVASVITTGADGINILKQPLASDDGPVIVVGSAEWSEWLFGLAMSLGRRLFWEPRNPLASPRRAHDVTVTRNLMPSDAHAVQGKLPDAKQGEQQNRRRSTSLKNQSVHPCSTEKAHIMMMHTVRSTIGLPPLAADVRKSTDAADCTGEFRAPFRSPEKPVPCFRARAPEPNVPSGPNRKNWRFLKAAFGKCNGCRKRFRHGTVIAWNLRSKLTLHPDCLERVYPTLATWIRSAVKDQKPKRVYRLPKATDVTTDADIPVLYTDGGCSNNGQRDIGKRLMIAVVTDAAGNVLVKKQQMGGSNNLAELWAVHEALVWCAEHGINKIVIRTDSKNNLAWLRNNRVGAANDPEAAERLLHAIDALRPKVTFQAVHISRAANRAGHHIERLNRARVLRAS